MVRKYPISNNDSRNATEGDTKWHLHRSSCHWNPCSILAGLALHRTRPQAEQMQMDWIISLERFKKLPLPLVTRHLAEPLFRHSDTAYTPFGSYSGTFGISTQFLCTPTFKMMQIPKGLGCSTCLYLNRNKFFLAHCSFYLTEQIGFLTFYFLLFNDFYSLG